MASEGDSIDRVAPTRRPDQPVRGYQRWRRLLFAHWEVPLAELRPLVPAGLEIDTFDGSAWIGLVPFWMEGVRPRWAPEALAFEFLETNVRTYVHVNGRDPGVYFLSLDAASRIAVWVARAGWGLPYFYSAMTEVEEGGVTHYRVNRNTPRGPALDVRYQPGEHLGASRPGSFEHFLVERYLLHLEKGGRIWTGQVHHVPYPVQRATVLEIDDQLVRAGGAASVDGMPPVVHYAAGVDVEIFDLKPRAE